MKRINTTKLMALLASLCLITSSFVGSTLAKYTTQASGADSARVAKFGVTITANGEMFKKTYAKDSVTSIANTVVSSTEHKLVAPGTKGELVECVLEGTPEVAVKVDYEATLDLSGWTVDGVDYCPLVITVNGTEYKKDTMAELKTAVEDAIDAYDAEYAANQDLSLEGTVATPDVEWKWDFEGNDDAKDTVLGNAGTATVLFAMTTTVTQLD